jgi:hypothetical protein
LGKRRRRPRDVLIPTLANLATLSLGEGIPQEGTGGTTAATNHALGKESSQRSAVRRRVVKIRRLELPELREVRALSRLGRQNRDGGVPNPLGM